MRKRYLGTDVLQAARSRIEWVFDTFPKIYLSFSGGKDSTLMMHLVAEEARRRHQKIGCMFIDWEAQFTATIDHVQVMYDMYRDCLDPYWITLPMLTVNSVSNYEPEWISWEHGKEELWVRARPDHSISDESQFPFYYYPMTFEEFVPAFGNWYADGELCAAFVGIRTRESLNRWRSVMGGKKTCYDGRQYTTRYSDTLYNAYPIYDWSASDIWGYHGKNPDKPYSRLYDLMHMSGVPMHSMRVCEPFGTEARQGLHLYHAIEPETWSKLVSRVSGANTGAMYGESRKSKGVFGVDAIVLKDGDTYQQLAYRLLDSLPTKTADHYKNKIAVYLRYLQTHGYPEGIPDTAHGDTGSQDIPSWRRICKVIMRGDYWCRGLSFSPTKTAAYDDYCNLMKIRREKWNLI